MKKNWINREEVISYALDIIMQGKGDEDTYIIASGSTYSDQEFLNLIEAQVENKNNYSDFEAWLFSELVCIEGLCGSDQEKINRLQDVYVKFDYPEIMKSCSIYYQGEGDPLVSMSCVIDDLRKNIL
jgi:hypothetical protein